MSLDRSDNGGKQMAKQCLIEKHKRLQAKFDALRKEEEKLAELPKEKREEAMAELKAKRVKARLFKARSYNRCAITGRAHGYFRYFGVCRHVLREKAHKGELPGIKKSSW
jgi:small subunit ribosomal protein S14